MYAIRSYYDPDFLPVRFNLAMLCNERRENDEAEKHLRAAIRLQSDHPDAQYSLAGLRFGYAIARPELIAGLMKVKDSYNVDSVSIAAATAAIKDVITSYSIHYTKLYELQPLRELP